MRTLINVSAFAVCMALPAVPAYAATQGDVGETSSGSSTITLEIPKLIIIDSFSDIPLGKYGGTGGLDGDSDLRVATNDDAANPTYGVKAIGNGTGNAFAVSRTGAGAAHEIPYKVFFNDETGTAGNEEIAVPDDAGALAGRTGINAGLTEAAENANIQVTFAQADLQAAPPGDYEGILTLVVTPE